MSPLLKAVVAGAQMGQRQGQGKNLQEIKQIMYFTQYLLCWVHKR